MIPLLIVLSALPFTVDTMFQQLANHYIQNAMKENERLISGIASELHGPFEYATAAKEFPEQAALVLSKHSTQFSHLAARLSRKLPNGAFEVASKYDPHSLLRDISPYPGDKWLGNASSFEGCLEDGEEILLTSFRPIAESANYYVEISALVDNSIEKRLRADKSINIVFAAHQDFIRRDNAHFELKSPGPGFGNSEAGKQIMLERKELDLLNKKDPRSKVRGYFSLPGMTYENGKKDLFVSVPYFIPRSVIYEAYTGIDIERDRRSIYIFLSLACMFAFAVILSLAIGFTISRHITRSVHDLYQGILALQNGDLQHRIAVRRSDQLGLLAHSFNQMSGSIGRLLEEVVEKKRLEKELEIAREVQRMLFPKQLPQPTGMSVFGGCKPARMVSGDYYDFIVEDETHLYIVVGDVSGKGISAALLMANLQAAIRSQLYSCKHDDPDAVGQNLVKVMTYLNHQIYLNSPEEKYATLFLSRYDANSRRLWYCNAGHLPPIVLDSDGIQSLAATGTVIGLVPDATYQAQSIELAPEALLAIFTDGVTEAINKADEDFGYKQLQTALEQSRMLSPEGVYDYVQSKIDEWTGDLPQRDDITLIVAKAG
jgi:serine phosphatase RsbU (regulator of sigma subunit)